MIAKFRSIPISDVPAASPAHGNFTARLIALPMNEAIVVEKPKNIASARSIASQISARHGFRVSTRLKDGDIYIWKVAAKEAELAAEVQHGK